MTFHVSSVRSFSPRTGTITNSAVGKPSSEAKIFQPARLPHQLTETRVSSVSTALVSKAPSGVRSNRWPRRFEAPRKTSLGADRACARSVTSDPAGTRTSPRSTRKKTGGLRVCSGGVTQASTVTSSAPINAPTSGVRASKKRLPACPPAMSVPPIKSAGKTARR